MFGQSGGGAKISTLMGMPAAKGLFHRAVVQSGSSLRQLTPDRSGSLSAATLQELGLTKATIDKLQEVAPEAIIQAGIRALRKLQPTPAAPGSAVPEPACIVLMTTGLLALKRNRRPKSAACA